MKFEMTNMQGTPDSRASGDLGSPYFQENRDPDPQIPRKMETWGHILGGPHFPITPVHMQCADSPHNIIRLLQARFAVGTSGALG